jgi:hypothetical protein
MPLSSTNLAAAGYDPATEILEIEFIKTGVYQYFNVPQVIYDGLMQAPSAGQFFNANIKNAFACTKA